METGHVIVYFLLNITYYNSLLQQVHQWHNPHVITASFKPTDLIFCPVCMYETINITDVAKVSSTSPPSFTSSMYQDALTLSTPALYLLENGSLFCVIKGLFTCLSKCIMNCSPETKKNP